MTPYPALSYSITSDIPTPTAYTSPSSPAKRRRTSIDRAPSPSHTPVALQPRQTITDQAQIEAALQQCEFDSGNEVISCFPTANDSFPQHQWATFVWNSRRPQLTQINLVDIFLFRADSRVQVAHLANQTNPSNRAGSVTLQVDDSWFGPQGENWSGQDTSFPFYWVLIRSDTTLDGDFEPQATFTAVQTTVLDSVASSMSSASAASASSSASASASAASVSAALGHGGSTATTGTSTGSTSGIGSSSTGVGGSGSVQRNGGDSDFPHWAIAVIVVLGFLAIVASGIVAFLCLRRMRTRRRRVSASHSQDDSTAPMMAEVGAASTSKSRDDPTSEGAATEHTAMSPRSPSDVAGDGASEISRAHSEASPFSGADAAIMAEAFRKALRKPDFAARPLEEGESPGSQEKKEGLIGQELADEGRGIRSVGSSRGVRIEGSDTGTIRDSAIEQ